MSNSDFQKNITFVEEWMKKFNAKEVTKFPHLQWVAVGMGIGDDASKKAVYVTHKPPTRQPVGISSCMVMLDMDHRQFVREMRMAFDQVRKKAVDSQNWIESQKFDGLNSHSMAPTSSQKIQAMVCHD